MTVEQQRENNRFQVVDSTAIEPGKTSRTWVRIPNRESIDAEILKDEVRVTNGEPETAPPIGRRTKITVSCADDDSHGTVAYYDKGKKKKIVQEIRETTVFGPAIIVGREIGSIHWTHKKGRLFGLPTLRRFLPKPK